MEGVPDPVMYPTLFPIFRWIKIKLEGDRFWTARPRLWTKKSKKSHSEANLFTLGSWVGECVTVSLNRLLPYCGKYGTVPLLTFSPLPYRLMTTVGLPQLSGSSWQGKEGRFIFTHPPRCFLCELGEYPSD